MTRHHWRDKRVQNRTHRYWISLEVVGSKTQIRFEFSRDASNQHEALLMALTRDR
jgi:hypothetical protein